MEKTFTISELEKVTGVGRRTIYYYTQEKLIPPPVGAGLSAKYEEIHYLRLKLIYHLQKSHLKLSGIKEIIDGMSIKEMRDKLKNIEKSDNWQFSTVFRSLSKSFFDKKEKEEMLDQTPSLMVSENISFVTNKQLVESVSTPKNQSIAEKKQHVPKAERTWKRYDVMEGVEVNIRSDIETEYGELLLQLLNEFYKHVKVRGLK